MALGMAERETTAAPAPGGWPRKTTAERAGGAHERSVDELLVAYHREGDRMAREQVIVEFMPLVRSLASRYAGRGEPLDDLVQVGAVGLIKAVDRFDVVPRRRLHELRACRRSSARSDGTSATRRGRCTSHGGSRSSASGCHACSTISRPTLGRSPTIAELAEAAGVDEEDVIDALDAAHAYSTRSLDAARRRIGVRAARGARARLRGGRRPAGFSPPASKPSTPAYGASSSSASSRR